MNKTVACDSVSAHQEQSSTFNIVVACEDSETGARALRTCDEIVSRLWRDFRFSTGLWKFEDLRKASAAQAAAREATQADMVILSTHARGDLPPEVKEWIEQWISNRVDARRALVALVDQSADQSGGLSSAEKYLEDAARRGDLDFFCNRRADGETPADKVRLTNMESISSVSDCSRWGLNE